MSGTTVTLIGLIGLCLTPCAGQAASKYDGSTPFVCVPTAVAECVSEGECRPGTAESENLPDFFKVDLKAKTIRAEDKGRLSPIKRIDRAADQITLYGSEAKRSWYPYDPRKDRAHVSFGYWRWRELRNLRCLPVVGAQVDPVISTEARFSVET